MSTAAPITLPDQSATGGSRLAAALGVVLAASPVVAVAVWMASLV